MLSLPLFQGVGGNSIIQVVGDGSAVNERPLYSGVLAALHQAQENIFVVTPYFVPDDPITASLELAVRMGCDVSVIIPEHSNHPHFIEPDRLTVKKICLLPALTSSNPVLFLVVIMSICANLLLIKRS